MADYSISSYTADGTTTDFLMTFDYLDVTHLKVFIDGVSADDVGSGYSYSLINSTTMRVTTDLLNPVTSGKLIEIKRVTPIDTPAVTFNDGSSINGGDLNKNTNYLLFAMQESVDNIHDTVAEGAALAQVATEGFRDEAEAFRDQAAVSAAAAAASEAGVAADAAAATTAATGAATSQTAAAASATSASTSATNAASSATSASTSASAASTSATSASTSATTAGGHATNAAASATSAGNSATSASSSASSASSSASSASSSASSATTSKNSAATSASDAASSATSASSSATTASLHKLAAEAAATSATSTAAALAGYDLAAIAESKAVTAVDVFVYDTSKDSDGGAWRKRCQHTSWYNETLNTATRGSRREFPAVAVIVAESSKVTIYDGDDPSLPMWMVFDAGLRYTLHNASTPTSVSMVNGELRIGCAGSSAGYLAEIGFLSDASLVRINSTTSYYIRDALSLRNSDINVNGAVSAGLVNREINDCAMTVLPDAPINPATGLQVPTIYAFTAGGVSRIADDGTVSSTASAAVPEGGIFEDQVWATFVSVGQTYSGSLPVSETLPTGGALNAPYYWRSGKTNTYDLYVDGIEPSISDDAFGLSTGLHSFDYSPADNSTSMLAITTSTYNTGWLPGDIKGAFLSDTDDTDLVGSGELVTNGTFDTDTSGWTAVGVDGGTDTTFSWNASGYMNVTRGVGSISGQPGQGFPTVAGKAYTISIDVVTAQRAFWTVSSTPAGSDIINTVTHAGNTTVTKTFVATSSTSYVRFWTDNSATTGIDNISVKLADADRSVNNNGLIVNGTVARSAVATGAELVAYSGFSASNYLEQPYNSALDFGTGDFCVMGWVKGTDASGKLFVRHDGTSSTDRIIIDVASGGYFRFYVDVASGLVTSTTLATTNTWIFVAGVRVGTTLYLYVNGALNASVTHAVNGYDLSNSNAVVNIGEHSDLSDPYGGSLALWRISATAPTAEQIAKIYEDEKVLFQENAAATLYGASDAVTALAHDPDTGLLHVGTSAGRSVFQGLRRVSNTTTAVGTAISASNNLIVEE